MKNEGGGAGKVVLCTLKKVFIHDKNPSEAYRECRGSRTRGED